MWQKVGNEMWDRRRRGTIWGSRNKAQNTNEMIERKKEGWRGGEKMKGLGIEKYRQTERTTTVAFEQFWYSRSRGPLR